MKVKRIDPVNFESRNPVIRNADDMARRICQRFPMSSSTKYLETNNYYKHFSDKIRKNNKTVDKILLLRWKFDKIETDSYKKCSNIIDSIKKLKVGNCGECSFLAKIFAEANGLKNIYRAELYCGTDDLDHSVLYVEDKKPYIIDIWLGFADYVPKAFERYVGEYSNFIFGKESAEQYLLSCYKRTSGTYDFNIPKETITKLTKKYPELLLKKAVSLDKGVTC